MSGPGFPEFPVEWEQPEDASLFWIRDVLHHPEQVRPLAGDLVKVVFEDGANDALEAYALPLSLRRLCTHGYCYTATVPVGSLDGAEHKVRETVDRMGQLWMGEWLPEIQGHLAFWEAFDLDAAPRAALINHLEETVARSRRLGAVHFLATIPGLLATSEFEDLYAEILGARLEAHDLLQGLNTKMAEMRDSVARLGDTARRTDSVRRLLADGPLDRVMTKLSDTPDGSRFATAVHTFLGTYGQRAANGWDVDHPSWIEDPSPLLSMLKTAPASQPQSIATAAAKREDMVRATWGRISGDSQEERFRELFLAARVSAVIKEDHNFWIDFAAPYRVRRVIQAWGRQLAQEGALNRADDVFWLTLTELRAAAASPAGVVRHEATVDRRREDAARYRTITPPSRMGTPPTGPLPDSPITRALGKVFGGPRPQVVENRLEGVAASRGLVQGPVRILARPEEGSLLRSGEILVARTTSPSWTPLFAVAAAVVTDVGGILSHSAVVAREYGIPAVVATGMATTLLSNGQLVEVDGTAGTVTILRP